MDETVVENLAKEQIEKLVSQFSDGLLEPLKLVEIVRTNVGAQFDEAIFDEYHDRRIKHLIRQVDEAKKEFVRAILQDNMVTTIVKIMEPSQEPEAIE